jgi:HEPN domain-containing protein
MLEHELWLLYVEYDLTIARQALYGSYVAIPTALTLCQQAAEKAVKAYLISKNHAFMRTHNIDLLIDQCLSFDSEFEILRSDAADLSPHVTISRYPDSIFGIPDYDTACVIFAKTEKIITFIKQKIERF